MLPNRYTGTKIAQAVKSGALYPGPIPSVFFWFRNGFVRGGNPAREVTVFIRSAALLAACASLSLASLGRAQGAVPPADTLYPNSTKAFVSVANTPNLTANWQKTLLHDLFDDEVMKPFTEDLRHQIDEKWLANHEKIGLSLEDLRGIASGELSGGLIGTASGRTAMVVLVDVTGNDAKATEALEKADRNLLKEKAKKSHKAISGVSVTIYDLPPKEDRQEARRVVYFLKDGLLAGADGLDALTDIIGRLGGKHNDSLSTVAPYQSVMKRLATAAGELKPDVRWFIDPLAVAEFRAKADEKKLKNVKMLRGEGFSAIQAVGGFVNLSVGEYEVLHRTAVYAPKPYERAMGMLEFPNSAPPAPPEWVAQNVVSFTTVNWEIKTAFERFGTLFDQLFGEGSEGTFNDTIDSVRDDPNGPGIDIRKDLVGHLGNHMMVLTDYETPITPSSERFVVAIETKNEKALAAAVQKSLETDENVEKREFENYVIWEMKAEEDALTSVVVERPDDATGNAALGVVTATNDKGGSGGRLRSKLGSEEEEEAVKLPNAAVAVARGQLFVSSHVDFLEKVLGGNQEGGRLADNADYKRVNEELTKLGANEVCIRNFTRADEQLRITYELFKAGKLPESETVLAQIIRSAQEEPADGTFRKPEFDGSKLPEYDVVRRYLGIGGTYVTTEENGWVVVGFLFRKEAK